MSNNDNNNNEREDKMNLVNEGVLPPDELDDRDERREEQESARSRETVADIVAEMRRGTKLPGYWHSSDLNKILTYHADRLEEAEKREHMSRRAIKVPIKVLLTGNTAAMREALLRCEAISCLPEIREQQCVRDMRNIIANALSAPARNCDVGTPEEQGERCLAQFNEWRRKSDGKKLITAIMAWAQMPYTAEEGGL